MHPLNVCSTALDQVVIRGGLDSNINGAVLLSAAEDQVSYSKFINPPSADPDPPVSIPCPVECSLLVALPGAAQPDQVFCKLGPDLLAEPFVFIEGGNSCDCIVATEVGSGRREWPGLLKGSNFLLFKKIEMM